MQSFLGDWHIATHSLLNIFAIALECQKLPQQDPIDQFSLFRLMHNSLMFELLTTTALYSL